MTMNEILRKLTSRKFILALFGMASGLAMAFGVEGSELMEVVSTVGGIITALGSAVAYINAEAKVDAAAAGVTKVILPEVDDDDEDAVA